MQFRAFFVLLSSDSVLLNVKRIMSAWRLATVVELRSAISLARSLALSFSA